MYRRDKLSLLDHPFQGDGGCMGAHDRDANTGSVSVLGLF